VRRPKRFGEAKTLMPGGFIPPEQIKRDGEPVRHGRMEDEELAKVAEPVAEKLGL